MGRRRVTRMRRFSAAVVFALVLGACGFGSGNLVSETRDVGPFTALDITGAVDVNLVVDPTSEQEVVVTYDDNLIDRIRTEVIGDTLHISQEGNVSTFGTGRMVSVVAQDLDSISVSGASDLDATGGVDSYRLEVAGASDVNLEDFEAEVVEIEVSGASDVRVHASESIEGEASGASDLRIYGNPDRALVDSSGASDVDIVG